MTIKLNLDDFKKEISLTKKKDENLIDLKDFEYISYTNNNEVDDFLNEKSFMLINFIGKSNIFLGNIFLEVQNYLNDNSIEETTYCDWLQRNGFNRMTALRYKKRAEIYSSLLSENSKKIIALANQKTIDEIYKFNDRQGILTYLEKINNISEIENYLNNALTLKKMKRRWR